MSCPLGVGQARAQDSYQQRVPKTYTKGLQMRPFFIFLRGALTQLNPGIMSRQINRKEAFSAFVDPWSAGLAVSAGVVPIRTADMALKSGSNKQAIPCPAVLSYFANAGDRNEFFNV